MCKKLTLLLMVTALCLWAADFWVAKPFTEWSEKEVQKMLTDSPWAKRVSVEMSFGGAGGRGGAPAGGGFAGGGGIAPPAGIGGDDIGAGGGAGGGGGGGRGGRGGGPQGATEAPPPVQSAMLIVRWYSALPMKQAMVKSQYGSEANTADGAKQILDRQEQFYVITVGGLPPTIARGGPDRKQTLIQQSALTVKGKEPLHPADIQINAQPQGAIAAYLFPRTTEFSMDDKEIEFSSKADRLNIKHKFKLKDMVLSGKLAL